VALKTSKAREQRFVLGVDLDGVVSDFYGGLRPIVAEWFDVPQQSLSLKNYSYGLPEWGIKIYRPEEDEKHDSYQKIHRFAVIERNLFKELRPIKGAAKVLRELSDEDIRIRIITHRLFIKYTHQIAIQQTVEWLDQWGIPYWDLCFMKDKAAVGADLYVEDAPKNVEDLRRGDHKTIVFTNPTNLSISAPRANSWVELKGMVLKELALSKRKGRSD
jgi:5'(3')-deoxyribonucleotidase